MNETVPQGGSSSASPARTGEAAPVRAHSGPQTVINPERRAAPPTIAEVPAAAGSSVKSSIVRILFPSDDEQAVQSFDPQSGVQLGHFAIIERIRTGGMGAVFRALDTRLARVVALKVLPPGLSRDPLIVQRFKNEAQAAAQLDHENVARVYFIGEDQGLHFIAFEFISGTNVRDLIVQQGRLSVAESVNYILQIASALVHTSAQGVVHRDIKPSNIIITPTGRAKLVDLGLARKENKDDQAADLTVAGTTLGTFDYISPEQARDPRVADVRSDVYSLGCTLYHMLTGEPPYPEGTVLQKLLQHQGDEAPDPSLKNRLVPENLAVVVCKMMAKDPRRRYQTAELLVRDLMLVAGALGLRSVSPEGLVWLAARPEHTSFWERHLAWMVTAAMLLVIVGYMEFGGWLYSPPSIAGTSSDQSPADVSREGSRTGHEVANSPAKGGAVSHPAGSGNTGADVSSKRPIAGEGGEKSPSSVAHDDEWYPADDDDSPMPDELKRPGATANVPNDDDNGDPDESPETVVPVPLTGSGRTTTPSTTPGAATESPGAASGTSPPKVAGGNKDPAVAPTEDPVRPARTEPAAIAETPLATFADDEGFYILGRDGAPDRRFATLESACSSVVRTDGAVIELRFNGRRREAGVKITRKVTIRAARGYRPVVEFRPTETAPDTFQVRAVWIPSGSLDLVGIDVVLSVDETVSADQWSLFSLERADSLRLSGVTVTLLNPRQRPMTAIELRPGAADKMPEMPVAGMPPKSPLEIEIAESLVRGDGDLFVVRHADPLRLAVKQSVVALQGALLSARGHSESAHDNAQIELRLEHMTAVLGGGLVRLDSGNMPRKLLPVQISASNSIFSNSTGAALIGMTGNAPPQDFRALLVWIGLNNFYDRYQTFVTITSTEGSGRNETWDSATWRSNWTEAAESNPRFDQVVWNKRMWTTKPFAELTASDFALDRQAANNAAVDGATNLSDAGANLAGLPKSAFVAGTADERAHD